MRMSGYWMGFTMVAVAVIAGCGDKSKSSPNGANSRNNDTDHDHDEAPHGGTILEFGKYHGEFCVDYNKKQVTVYILDDAVKNAVPITADKLTLSIKNPQFQTDLIASPQDGDPKGSASRFIATDARFSKIQDFAGTISGVLDGKPYLGDFKEDSHDDHNHSPDPDHDHDRK